MNAHERRSRSFQALVDLALKIGASRAKVISTKDVVTDKRVRLKCLVPRCENYDRHLMCPPNTLDVNGFREILAAYRHAVILQVEARYSAAGKRRDALVKSTKGHSKDPEIRLHKIVKEVERAAFKEGLYLAAGLIASDCSLCASCVGSNSPVECRHPFEARPSMQSLGIDVIRTCENAGMPVTFSPEEPVKWTGLVLLD